MLFEFFQRTNILSFKHAALVGCLQMNKTQNRMGQHKSIGLEKMSSTNSTSVAIMFKFQNVMGNSMCT